MNQVPGLACVNISVCVAPDDKYAGAACTDDVIAADEGICRTPHDPVSTDLLSSFSRRRRSPRGIMVHRIAFAAAARPYLATCYRAEPAKDQIQHQSR